MWIKDKSYEVSFQNWYKVFVLWDTIVSKLEATAYFALSLFICFDTSTALTPLH